MPHSQEDVTSPVAEEKKKLSLHSESESSQDEMNDNETFEDAVDTKSIRSLTKRTTSYSSKEPISPKQEIDHDVGLPAQKIEEDTNSKVELSDSETEIPEPEIEEVVVSEQENAPAASNRFSSTSNLDNVDLNDEIPSQSGGDESKVQTVKEEPSNKTMSFSSITNALPAMPWSPPTESPSKSPSITAAASLSSMPPPPPPPETKPQPPAPPARRLTSPFSWLSRNSSKKEESPPPAPSPRRNTASSIATLASNPEMMLSRLEEETGGEDGEAVRNSLKDRFKQLRMREQATVGPAQDGSEKHTDNIASHGDEAKPVEAVPPSSVPVPDKSLAPGTVSGINAGPSAMAETDVDWDLWQSVVYEGPAAVARTSAKELNKAIATGIPSAIRGVIWQVLAQSQDTNLERTYKELIVRGTDKEKARHSSSTTASAANLAAQNGDAVKSSSSSIHSIQSGGNGQPSPQKEIPPLSAEERKRKEKEDAASLQKLEKMIRRDLGARTSYSKYAAAQGLQESLFGVCKAYALFDEGVGYAQGMNFLIMPLLFNMPEEEAFSLLVRLMHHYGLRDLFVQDMPGLHMHLFQFERLLEDHEPAVYCHLHRRGISPHLYATQWFLTLFAYRFPLQLVLRIYDLILSEGLSAILRFGLVLMQKNSSTLLGISDMQQLTTHLKDKLFDVYLDKDPSQGSILESGFFGSSSSSLDKEVYHADQLVRDACDIKITPETLKAYTVEWQEKTKAEKDRETELYELRTANTHLAIKVRKLEESVEVCDREQAALATELVHTKVENQELKDENESLKGQVRELKIVIEKQPIEIEQTWQLERDDLMKRNMKVHEENQELEKNLVDLEEQLVQTKLQYAEINSQYEALNRKWADLKRQFA